MASKSNVDWDNILMIALIGAGAYVAYRVMNVAERAAGAVSDALTNTGSAIGGKIYEVFHPDVVGETIFYTVSFPAPVGDGQKHSVPSRAVNNSGYFVLGPAWGDGKATPIPMRRRWRIVVDQSTRLKVAQPA